MSDTVALIVAAGRGSRLPGVQPKQYRTLAGVPVLRWCLDAFVGHPDVTAVQVVTGADDTAHYASAIGDLDLLAPVTGGPTRQESVLRGLEAIAEHVPSASRVLIHDGARPFVSPELISTVNRALDTASGVVPVLAVTDTIKRVDDGRVGATVDRTGLFRAQTPQGFDFAQLLSAHREHAGRDFTDDAAIAEAAGLLVLAVRGEETNLKITHPEDLDRAEAALAATRETRTGSGFDVHAFADGDRVRLCGIEIPHDRTLSGHSDADVGLHAMTDAILGAIGDGDIGQQFPPTDPQWRGASSDRFLRHAHERLVERGGAVVHVDVTIICERPKIGPHRDAMRQAVAQILDVAVDRVSVKATTTEGLGFTGRGEGIAAQAVATVTLPVAR